MAADWSPPGHERVPQPPTSYSSYAPQPYPDYGAAPTPGHPITPTPLGAPPPPEVADPFALPPELAQQALAGPGYQSPRLRNSPLAITTMALALVLFFVPWACVGVIVLGHVTLHRLKDSFDGGRGLVHGALGLAYLSVVGWTALYLT